jgi:hypothetical protein
MAANFRMEFLLFSVRAAKFTAQCKSGGATPALTGEHFRLNQFAHFDRTHLNGDALLATVDQAFKNGPAAADDVRRRRYSVHVAFSSTQPSLLQVHWAANGTVIVAVHMSAFGTKRT